MLDFRIETFLSVCRCKSYTAAARELNITQPAVSQHIRHLEALYGVKLFDYQNKRLTLTSAGKELERAATTLRHDALYLKERLQDIKAGTHSLIFGATRTIGDFDLSEKLTAYIKKLPNVTIKLQLDNTATLLDRLNQGEIDFALVEGYFTKSEYSYRMYQSVPFFAVSALPAHKSPCALEDLFSETLIVREKGSGSREILEQYLKENNASIGDFQNILEINSVHIIKKLVLARCGITFLYQIAAKEELKKEMLFPIAIRQMNVSHDFALVWRKGSIYQEEYLKQFDALFHEA